MESVTFLNISYIIARLYQIVTGYSPDVDPWLLANQIRGILQNVAVAGIILSILMLVLIIYYHIRVTQVEEFIEEQELHKFHSYHAAAHATQEAKNPRWEAVVGLMTSPNESDWRRAILDADIMLSELLLEKGYVGKSVGDQLKMGNPLQFTTLNLAWEAHKMRNALAHLGEAFPLNERDARATIDLYRRVFEEFNYI